MINSLIFCRRTCKGVDMQSELQKLKHIIEFRRHVKKFNDILEKESNSLNSHYQNIKPYWADEQYREYGKLLEDIYKGIRHYTQQSKKHENYLATLIERLKKYVETSLP